MGIVSDNRRRQVIHAACGSVLPAAGVGGFGDETRGTGLLDLRLRSAGLGDLALSLQLHREEPGCWDR